MDGGVLSPTDQQSLVSSFLEIAVGQTADTARQFLQATSWKLEEAIQLFYIGNDGGTATATSAQSMQFQSDVPLPDPSWSGSRNHAEDENVRQGDGDDVRPPLPVIRDVLYDNTMSYGASTMGGSSHAAHSVVPFRNFQEEMKRSGVWETENGSALTVDNSRDNLASLYRPPFALMYQGPFEKAKDAARVQNKWLLVNLQSTREFSSHMLNRDTWANDAVAQTIKSNFIFWQVYDDTEEGSKVCTYYKLDSIPVVTVIDPVTGQKIRSWHGMVQPETLLEALLTFMDGSPTDHHVNLSHKRPRESSQAPLHRVQAIGSVDVVAKVEKKRKKKKIKIEAAVDALQEVNTYLTESGPQVNKNQRIKVIELEAFGEDRDLDSIEKQGKKKRKREKKNKTDISGGTGQDILAEEYTEGNANSTMNEKGDSDLKNGSKWKRTKAKLVDNASEDPKRKKSKKRVRFSDDVEVFPPSDGLLRGKRFSKEEDELVKEAVFKYIEAHCLGEEGLEMVLNCKSHPEIRDCWKEIATALPYRPQSSVYYRAQILFRRDEKHKWTEEEIDLVRKFQEKHGNQWKVLADELGKHRFHVKDTWRRIRHENLNKGRWSQEEYQALFDLVNTDLRMKYSEDKKSKHGMLRDNIAWTAISDKLSTRTDANCCLKWYNQLTSSMVAEGVWADADDYRVIDALFQLDASCSEDVDWDNLLDHRPGDICRKRWNQMVLHIGDNGNKAFADQVELLAKRYCPDSLEVRESWDSKPVVP